MRNPVQYALSYPSNKINENINCFYFKETSFLLCIYLPNIQYSFWIASD